MTMYEDLKSQLESLSAEVRELKDRQQIQRVVLNYARSLDRLDKGLLESVFHEEAVTHNGTNVQYAGDFIKRILPLEESFVGTQHAVANHYCEIDGDSAHSETYVTWYVKPVDAEIIRAGGGRYIDRLERRGGTWRVILRRLLVDWSGTFQRSGTIESGWNQFGARDKSDPSYLRPLQLDPDAQKIADAQTRSNRDQQRSG
jgi:SnoaL-like domain